MLIKLYSPNYSVFIIENARCIQVHLGAYSWNSLDELFSDSFGPKPKLNPLIFYELQEPETGPNYCRFIDYVDDMDISRRVRVDYLAYVCNDMGKTIEKVDAENLPLPKVS